MDYAGTFLVAMAPLNGNSRNQISPRLAKLKAAMGLKEEEISRLRECLALIDRQRCKNYFCMGLLAEIIGSFRETIENVAGSDFSEPVLSHSLESFLADFQNKKIWADPDITSFNEIYHYLGLLSISLRMELHQMRPNRLS